MYTGPEPGCAMDLPGWTSSRTSGRLPQPERSSALQEVERLATEVALLTGQGPPPGLPLLCIGGGFAQTDFAPEPLAQ